MHEVYDWILNFIGVNNTYNDFSTHMYNFWSGFGGNISVLALLGTVFGVYRHNLKRLDALRHAEALKFEKLETIIPNAFHKRDQDKDTDKDKDK
jgi:hypothetical protein